MTLRERLQARRERIRAGLPPPQPVTVTESFFAKGVLANNRVCKVCGNEYRPRGREYVCGDVCRTEWERKSKAAKVVKRKGMVA